MAVESQEDPTHLLAGNNLCFTSLLNSTEEICMCPEDGCNKDQKTAKKALNIPMEARPFPCGGKDCPVMDITKVINGWKGFNTACYKRRGEERERCFTTEGIYSEEVVDAAREDQRGVETNFTFTYKTSGSGSLGRSLLVFTWCVVMESIIA